MKALHPIRAHWEVTRAKALVYFGTALKGVGTVLQMQGEVLYVRARRRFLAYVAEARSETEQNDTGVEPSPEASPEASPAPEPEFSDPQHGAPPEPPEGAGIELSSEHIDAILRGEVSLESFDTLSCEETLDRFEAATGTRPAVVPAPEGFWTIEETEEAMVTLVCPRDGAAIEKYPNPRQAPGFGSEFRCTSCGYTWTE